jgi:hypothetical protein
MRVSRMYKTAESLDAIGKAIQTGTQEEVQNAIKAYQKNTGKPISGADLAKLTPNNTNVDKLTFGQNVKALGSQAKWSHANPMTWMKEGWKEMGAQGGEGLAGGAGTKMRHIPLGARLGTAAMLIPSLAQAPQAEDPTGQGRSRTERVGVVAGGLAGSLAGTIPMAVTKRLTGVGGMAIPMLAGYGGMVAGEYLGGKAGKLVDAGVSKSRGVASGDATNQRYMDSKRQKPTAGAF